MYQSICVFFPNPIVADCCCHITRPTTPNHVFYYFLPNFHSFTQQSFSLFVSVFFSYHCSFDFHHVAISLQIGFDIQCKHSFSGEQQSNNTNGCHLCIWTVVGHFNGCSGVSASHNISKGDRLLKELYKHHLKEQ